ncbi:MAG: F0F1 ATP synthase subunit A [Clostridiales bacterium]|nr:F0F1 ATP synthase subunit A [Clostridiales bacterium]
MKKKERKFEKNQICEFIILLVIAAVCLVCSLLIGSAEKTETIQEVMKDGVLHETGRISLLGLMEVNPAYISSLIVVIALLVFAACVRIFVIPYFQYVPGKFQLLLETWVGFFDNMAKSNSPHRHKFLSVYIFTAGSYIFIGTLFELLGLQWVTTHGTSIALPAPLSDINAAIAMGCLSYGIIMSGGIAGNGLKGVGKTLRDFSLPISMSFRLFGALLSGLLVTELVYYFVQLSFILPVVVGILFTLLHALIQSYVLTMLTALFYGEVSERHPKKPRTAKPKQKSLADQAG